MERFVLPAHGRSETQPTQHPKALPLFFGRKKPGQKHHHFLEVNQKPEGSFFFSHFFRENSALFFRMIATWMLLHLHKYPSASSPYHRTLTLCLRCKDVPGHRKQAYTHKTRRWVVFFWALKISAEDTPRLNKRLGVTWVVQVAGDGNLCGIWVV